jgi:hypothetical protein
VAGGGVGGGTVARRLWPSECRPAMMASRSSRPNIRQLGPFNKFTLVQ